MGRLLLKKQFPKYYFLTDCMKRMVIGGVRCSLPLVPRWLLLKSRPLWNLSGLGNETSHRDAFHQIWSKKIFFSFILGRTSPSSTIFCQGDDDHYHDCDDNLDDDPDDGEDDDGVTDDEEDGDEYDEDDHDDDDQHLRWLNHFPSFPLLFSICWKDKVLVVVVQR